MNQLSWLLYIADVVGSLNVVLTLTALGLLIVSVICFIMSVTYDAGSSFDEDKVVRKQAKAKLKIILPLMVLVALIGCMVPSRNTVYAIAASQIGEQVLKTPVAGKAEQALESWLDKQIRDNNSSDDKKSDDSKKDN